jgi:Isochorismatase family
MTSCINPNDLTTENCLVVIIDQPPSVALTVQSEAWGEVVSNVEALVGAAGALGVPVVVTAPETGGGLLASGVFGAERPTSGGLVPILRRSANAWPELRDAVSTFDRRKLLIAGLWTEVGVAQTVLSALKEGYRIYFVSDGSVGATAEAHQDAKTRMVQAGATPINWMAIAWEWAPGYATPEHERIDTVLRQNRNRATSAPTTLPA